VWLLCVGMTGASIFARIEREEQKPMEGVKGVIDCGY